MIKTLSIKQPWAQLIVTGIKDVENRSWRAFYQGRLLIHAPINWDVDEDGLNPIHLFTQKQFELIPVDIKEKIYKKELSHSAIIGEVKLINCVKNSRSVWAVPGQWHWVLSEPKLYEKPILNVKGHRSLWDFDIEKVLVNLK